MKLQRCVFKSFAIAVSVSALSAQQPAPSQQVRVMIVGSFHMSNPGHDLHNIQVEDVLQPKSQAEIKTVVDSLAAFHPSKVMVEWPEDLVDERYPRYVAGTLAPSRNEVVQLGFRLAKQSALSRVYGIDVGGDFPYPAVQAFAEAHGQGGILAEADSRGERTVQTLNGLLKEKGIAATLRFLNDPKRVKDDNSFYRQTLLIGAGTQQPGADLLTAWYKRNFLICANILQKSTPGDHIVVIYGSGHAFLLRQCLVETPGFTLVEPATYLPQ